MGTKNVQNSARFRTTLDFDITNISGMDQHIEDQKTVWSTAISPLRSAKQIWWNLVHWRESEHHIWAHMGAGPSNFFTCAKEWLAF